VRSPPVVSNSSALIALRQIGHLDLLERLFGEVMIPPAVAREIGPSVSAPRWVNEQSLTQPVGPRILRAALGLGESEAISLALETGARRLILDERPARRLAQSLDLPVVGTLGILLASKRRGLLIRIRPSMDALMGFGFRVGPDLYDHVLTAAGEAEP